MNTRKCIFCGGLAGFVRACVFCGALLGAVTSRDIDVVNDTAQAILDARSTASATDNFQPAIVEMAQGPSTAQQVPFTTKQPSPIHWQDTWQMPPRGQMNTWMHTASTN
jgi:hypothetical protein